MKGNDSTSRDLAAMTTLARMALAITVLMFGLIGAAAPAPAGRSLRPQEHESVQDQMRCDALLQQVTAAAARRPVDGAASDQASQGEVLCRAGRYGEGAETLEKALLMIGEKPGQ